MEVENELNPIRMMDVGAKSPTAREAKAQGTLYLTEEAFLALRFGSLRKGDALDAARLAGILAAKKTSELIPLCHPLPLEKIQIDFELNETERKVTAIATVGCEAKTGVEMEALEATAQALLTLYDMCKPYGQEMRITDIFLVSKTGGKSGDYQAS